MNEEVAPRVYASTSFRDNWALLHQRRVAERAL